jgi:hypothetical protein
MKNVRLKPTGSKKTDPMNLVRALENCSGPDMYCPFNPSDTDIASHCGDWCSLFDTDMNKAGQIEVTCGVGGLIGILVE